MSYTLRPHSFSKGRTGNLFDLRTSGVGIPLKANWDERVCVVKPGFTAVYDKIYNFEVYDDDVFVVTYPKCGSTWMQEVAWLLLNNLDFKTAKEIPSMTRSINLEQEAVYPELKIPTIKIAAELNRPRLIKCHLHAHALPRQIWEKKTKIIYVARNPKDVIVSRHSMRKGIGKWNEFTFNEFIDDIINAETLYSPYWPHVLDFWKMRHEPQIFFTTYEDMKRDLQDVLTKLCQFLEIPEPNESQMKELLNHLSFESMRENDNAQPTKEIKTTFKNVDENFHFLRRGIVGAYRDELSEESQLKIDEWTKRSLEGQNVTEEEIFGKHHNCIV